MFTLVCFFPVCACPTNPRKCKAINLPCVRACVRLNPFTDSSSLDSWDWISTTDVGYILLAIGYITLSNGKTKFICSVFKPVSLIFREIDNSKEI